MNPREKPLDEDSTPSRWGRRRGQRNLDQAITALVEGGLVDNRAIAGQLGISPQSVRRRRRQLGITNPQLAERLTTVSHEAGEPSLTVAIRRLLRKGLSNREVAQRLGVSEMTIYRHLRANGPRPSAKKTRLERDDGYPEAFLRQVPIDQTLILPPNYLQALLRAAARCNTPAAHESLRQALLLHES